MIHSGIDGLKVDTQVLNLLRILFVEHYKHTLVILLLISLGKVRMTYVGYACEIARSTGCGQICINGYAVSQKFRAARTSNEAHNAWSCGVAVFLQRTLR